MIGKNQIKACMVITQTFILVYIVKVLNILLISFCKYLDVIDCSVCSERFIVLRFNSSCLSPFMTVNYRVYFNLR